jgi:hypothetical protein
MIDRFHPSSLLCLTLLLIVATPHRVTAQSDGRIDVAGGYSFMRDHDGGVSFPTGWFASVGGDLAGPIGIVGDASGSYKSMGGLDIDFSMSIHTFMGGPRLAWRTSRVTPRAEVLFGTARMATTFTMPEETVSFSRYHFAMQFGGGMDVQLTSRVAARVGANRRLIRSEMFTPTGSEPFNYREFQFISGVVFR